MDELTQQNIEHARASGKTIGLVQGSWDMFHLGHLRYLQEARKTCDFLVVAMDDDEKIRYRKGNNRPIIPLEERYQTIERLRIADALIVKKLGEPHWGLIKTIRPDVLVAIKENYSDDEIVELEKICGRVAVLPRQATTSTSEIIRRTLIRNGVKLPNKSDPRVAGAAENIKLRVGVTDKSPKPWPKLFEALKKSTDWVQPVAAGYLHNGKWFFGANYVDATLWDDEVNNRTELFYATVEHAEVDLLKKLTNVAKLKGPVYVTLFPCDKCIKVLADKGVKEIYYVEDHTENNWSKRAHERAAKYGIRTVQVSFNEDGSVTEREDAAGDGAAKAKLSVAESNKKYGRYKYIDPRNARKQDQLDVMLKNEAAGKDPLALENVDPDQEVLSQKKYWYVTRNRYPYEGVKYQFLVFALGPVYSPDEISAAMWKELQEIWNELRKKYNLLGGAFCMRFGDTLCSGASLKRVHAHIIVPEEGSKTKFGVGGQLELDEHLRI